MFSGPNFNGAVAASPVDTTASRSPEYDRALLYSKVGNDIHGMVNRVAGLVLEVSEISEYSSAEEMRKTKEDFLYSLKTFSDGIDDIAFQLNKPTQAWLRAGYLTVARASQNYISGLNSLLESLEEIAFEGKTQDLRLSENAIGRFNEATEALTSKLNAFEAAVQTEDFNVIQDTVGVFKKVALPVAAFAAGLAWGAYRLRSGK